MFGFIGDIIGGIGNAIGGAVHTAQKMIGGAIHTAEEVIGGIMGHPQRPEPKPHPRPVQRLTPTVHARNPMPHHPTIAKHASYSPRTEMLALERERDQLRRKHAILTQRANQLQQEMANLQTQIAMDAAAIPGSGGGIDEGIKGDSGDDGKDKNNMLLYAGIGIAAIAAMYFFMKKK